LTSNQDDLIIRNNRDFSLELDPVREVVLGRFLKTPNLTGDVGFSIWGDPGASGNKGIKTGLKNFIR
jgi:hypothetical protein